jgi:chemotaxis protein histidine kinase CheA
MPAMSNENPAPQAGESAAPEPSELGENVAKLEPKELVEFREAVEWLADQSEAERSYWLPKKAETLHVEEKKLRSTVAGVLRERALQTAAKRLEEDRAAKQRAEIQVEARREHDRVRKEKARIKKEADKSAAAAKKAAELKAEREKRKAELKAEREQREAEKEAERKAKERAKALGNLLKLPVARHEQELQRLAERLGEDVAALREELDELIGLERGDVFTFEKTEPWPGPVDVASVLEECSAKICRYVVCQPHHLTATVLWIPHAWLYDYGIPVHSPMLAATSAEPDSGKSTLVNVVGRACPRLSLNIEITGPTLFRLVDAFRPTIVLDEADDLFIRKSDLKHIINASWTRGAKISRQVKINGVWQTVFFDPFGPKAISLLGHDLPPQTRTRCIELRMLPKRHGEEVEEFNQLDDPEFAILRRKFARLAADNAAALKDAKPIIPSGLNNRVAANWKLLLAIAELAGGDWPKRAREAAEHLSRSGRKPSAGVQLLAATKAIRNENRITEITSETLMANLTADPTSIWAGYNHGGPITQRQIAILFDQYEIWPTSLHPTKRKDFSRQGYKLFSRQFEDAFARYVPDDPIIQSPTKASPNKRLSSTKKRRSAKRKQRARRK